MKRVLLLVLAVGLLAGQAFADMYYTPSTSVATQFRDISYSDPGGKLKWVGYNDGTPVPTPQIGVHVYGSGTQYGEEMRLAVGFMGKLSDSLSVSDPDSFAWVSIGAGYTGSSVFNTIQHAGTYSGFRLSIANDDDDPWDYALYMVTQGSSYPSPLPSALAFTTLDAGEQTVLTLDFGTDVDFANVTDLGFVIRGDFAHGPSNPDYYHTSVVPVPAAAVLGVLGLGVAGLKLRRRA
jgi:hypothetical protein